MSPSYRTLWISDTHLGTEAARATDLLRFLDHVSADTIYLVGDIIDLEQMRERPIFPDTHRQVLLRFLELSNSGTRVIYIPGNHDHDFRSLVGRDICGIPVMQEAEHTTAAGERLLIAHGDVLDGRMNRGGSQHTLGVAAYRLVMRVDVTINYFGRFLGQDHLPITARIKEYIQAANQYILRFEKTAASYAEERGYDGIVCGHIHRPCIRRVGETLYANDGDWVEHRTALGEGKDGKLEVLQWKSGAIQTRPTSAPEPLAA